MSMPPITPRQPQSQDEHEVASILAIVSARESPVTRSLGQLLAAIGANPLAMTPHQVALGVKRRAVCGAIVFASALEVVDERSSCALLTALSEKPVFIYGLGKSPRVQEAITEVYGVDVRRIEPVSTRDYQFADDHQILWPFNGMRLSEAADRLVTGVHGGAFRPLLSTFAGPVLAQLMAGSRELFISTVGNWPGGPPALLRHAFSPSCFMDTLPALIFGRHVLDRQGWKRPRSHANVIVDDPNLRFSKYGYLHYGEAIGLARELNFHLTLGFVPLDYRRTDKRVAQLFFDNPGQVSLVMHGNDHRKYELARHVSRAHADFAVHQALARMDRHRQVTSLACPRVMTMPHGYGSKPWIRALRDAGYTAAMCRSYAFSDSPEDDGAGPLYEMMPADLSMFGFPILHRLRLEGPREDLLFAAWLGKPVSVYTHHKFFATGWNRFLEVVDFINRHIGPNWVDVKTMVTGNYLLRTIGRKAEVWAFSNDVAIDIPPNVDELVCFKVGCDVPWESEVACVDGVEVEAAERSREGIRIVLPAAELSNRVNVQFVSTLAQRPPIGWQRTQLVSRARRLVTETRDRLAPMMS